MARTNTLIFSLFHSNGSKIKQSSSTTARSAAETELGTPSTGAREHCVQGRDGNLSGVWKPKSRVAEVWPVCHRTALAVWKQDSGGGQSSQWGKVGLFNKWCWANLLTIWKEEKKLDPYPQPKKTEDLNVKTETWRKEHRGKYLLNIRMGEPRPDTEEVTHLSS